MPAPPTFAEVCFKASHNSFERDERPIVRQIDWHKSSTSKDGCRGLELDLHQSQSLWIWSVNHLGPFEPGTDNQFTEYLGLLRQWSDLHSGHDVVTVTLDIKTKPEDLREFPRWFDATVSRHFGEEKLFRPQDLMQGSKSLVEGAMGNGWPQLGELQGRFILCLSGREDVKRTYARGNRTRLCFADQRLRPGDPMPSVRDGDRVFFNLNLMTDWNWQKVAKWLGKKRGFVSRGYTVNSRHLWEEAMAAGINIIATDKVRKHPWASVGNSPFRLIES